MAYGFIEINNQIFEFEVPKAIAPYSVDALSTFSFAMLNLAIFNANYIATAFSFPNFYATIRFHVPHPVFISKFSRDDLELQTRGEKDISSSGQ